MNLGVFVAAISDYVVSCLASQAPPVTLRGPDAQINYGLDYIARADTFPRIVATPAEGPEQYGPADKWSQDMSDPAQTTFTPSSFSVAALVDFHIWGASESDCLAMVADICEGLQQRASGVSWPVLGFWPQVRAGKTLTVVAGKEYVLRVAVKMPVTRAAYPTVSGVSGSITTIMDFADGTTQQDPE